jgi:hypothetical protein
MRNRNEHNVVSIQTRKPGPQRPVISVAVASRSGSGYLLSGMALGLVFGFVIGSVTALIVGDKSLLFAQHVWNRMFGVEAADGERVHFEWLLQ